MLPPALVSNWRLKSASIPSSIRLCTTTEPDVNASDAGTAIMLNARFPPAESPEVSKYAETIKNSSLKILDRVRVDREALSAQVELLREKLAGLRQLLDEEVE